MRWDRLPAKIRSKSDSNWLLIDFYDLNLAVRSIVATISIWNPDYLDPLKSKFNQNWSKITGFCRFTVVFDIICRFRLKYRHFRLINWHLVNLNWSFNRYYIEIEWLYIKIAVVDSIKLLVIESDRNQRS